MLPSALMRALLLAVLAAVTASAPPFPAQDLTGTDHTIWLRSAASQWDHALPVGNGRMGAMVFGTVNRERIQLNEET